MPRNSVTINDADCDRTAQAGQRGAYNETGRMLGDTFGSVIAYSKLRPGL
jgi:hypothetical protein